jgi:Icc-related predicted phosphoesterase
MSNKMKVTLEDAREALGQVAQIANMHPQEITLKQLTAYDERMTEWALRKFGGITKIKDYFPYDQKDLIEIKKAQDVKKYVNKLEKELANQKTFEKSLLGAISELGKKLPKMKVKRVKPKSTKGKKMTIEVMLSDIHYGKLSDGFNLKKCRERMRDLTTVLLSEIEQKQKSFNVEKVIVALIGDIIESSSMHGMESMMGSEFGNSKQVQEAIESLFYDTLLPIAETGIKVVVPCVPGNHDRYDTSRTMQKPGLNNLSWIIYKMLESLANAHKLKNVQFDITEDSYVVHSIYGSNVLYEHGDELRNVQKGTILNHMEKRGRQIGKQIHMARFGHWHEYVCFNRGQAIVNESVCGQDSYAKIKGFSSTAGQTINFYVETKNRPTSFYYSFPVFLG